LLLKFSYSGYDFNYMSPRYIYKVVGSAQISSIYGNKNKIYLKFLKNKQGQNYSFKFKIKWNQSALIEFKKSNYSVLLYYYYGGILSKIFNLLKELKSNIFILSKLGNS